MADESRPRRSIAVPWVMIEPWAAPLLIALAVFAFYSLPMLDPAACIHWDAANVYLPLQKYFAEHLRAGHPPYWTPYLFSGYPILANPEMGAFYPLNWPFFLFWMTFHGIQCELMLHAFIACLGAYYFFRTIGCRTSPSVLGAFAFGLSGFFAGHSSHVTVFVTAAWFPWLLLCYRRAVDRESPASVAYGGIVGGAMVLAGSLPTAIFGLFGLAWYVLSDLISYPKLRIRAVLACAGIVILSVAISGMTLFPAIELIQRSTFTAGYGAELLQFRHLLTLLLPNAIGTISNTDRGLVTNHYFYAGILLLPLAVAGWLNWRIVRPAFWLVLPAVWYMLGPSGVLYRAGAAIPAMQQMGPVNIGWFLPAFGLAWMAAAGSHRLFARFRYISVACAFLMLADLWYWNIYRNPLAYDHQYDDQAYSERIGRAVAAPQLPLSRFHSPAPLDGVGPRLFPLDLKFETTTGYLVLEPSIYRQYFNAMLQNPKLRDGLNVGRYLNPATGRIEVNPDSLPRAYFPHTVRAVATEKEALASLDALNPTEESTVTAQDYVLHQDPHAEPFIVGSDEKSYGVHYRTAAPSLLKLSVPWYPGWVAHVNGTPVPIVRVDYALMGVIVPAGDGVVEFRFRSRYLGLGVLSTVLGALAMAALLVGKPIWRRIAMQPEPL